MTSPSLLSQLQAGRDYQNSQQEMTVIRDQFGGDANAYRQAMSQFQGQAVLPNLTPEQLAQSPAVTGSDMYRNPAYGSVGSERTSGGNPALLSQLQRASGQNFRGGQQAVLPQNDIARADGQPLGMDRAGQPQSSLSPQRLQEILATRDTGQGGNYQQMLADSQANFQRQMQDPAFAQRQAQIDADFARREAAGEIAYVNGGGAAQPRILPAMQQIADDRRRQQMGQAPQPNPLQLAAIQRASQQQGQTGQSAQATPGVTPILTAMGGAGAPTMSGYDNSQFQAGPGPRTAQQGMITPNGDVQMNLSPDQRAQIDQRAQNRTANWGMPASQNQQYQTMQRGVQQQQEQDQMRRMAQQEPYRRGAPGGQRQQQPAQRPQQQAAPQTPPTFRQQEQRPAVTPGYNIYGGAHQSALQGAMELENQQRQQQRQQPVQQSADADKDPYQQPRQQFK